MAVGSPFGRAGSVPSGNPAHALIMKVIRGFLRDNQGPNLGGIDEVLVAFTTEIRNDAESRRLGSAQE